MRSSGKGQVRLKLGSHTVAALIASLRRHRRRLVGCHTQRKGVLDPPTLEDLTALAIAPRDREQAVAGAFQAEDIRQRRYGGPREVVTTNDVCASEIHHPGHDLRGRLLSEPTSCDAAFPKGAFCSRGNGWTLQSAGGRVSQSSARHEYMAGDAKLTQDNRNRSCLDLRRQLGGCKPGDSSHALICEPVSACRALRISSSRAAPGGSCRASSRRRFASCASRTSRGWIA
jgi:hypothetical protein